MEIDFKSLSYSELQQSLKEMGVNEIHAHTLFKHVYYSGNYDLDVDLSDAIKEKLNSNFVIRKLKLVDRKWSKDGTVKFLFELYDGLKIESVLIPQKGKFCACVSTQVGCALGCKFCVSGKDGFVRNLETWELVEQVMVINNYKNIYSLVFMGSGEPFHNYDPLIKAIGILNDHRGLNFGQKQITVSTAGIPDKIIEFGNDTVANLAVSLNAVDDEFRSKIMPVNSKYSISSVIDACKQFNASPKRMILIEYILFRNLNDSLEHAGRLFDLLQGFHCSVNLIPFNSHPYCSFETPDMDDVVAFKEFLRDKGLKVFIRESHGNDINAACGMLSCSYDEV